jgi:glutaryl-CoA dehydrogenase (non-decarboxylating)
MNFDLPEEIQAVQSLAREFAEKELAPSAAEDDRQARFRPDLIKKMAELGFFGCVIPEEYGGNGMGYLATVVITEEIARVHSAMRVFINMQIGPALTLLKFGTEAQKREYIPRLVAAEDLSCFAITEPNAGSDVAAISTMATRQGDLYRLDGSKNFISNAPVADTALIYASTDKAAKHRGMSAFYSSLKREGLTRGTTHALGVHCSPLGELSFDGFTVPADNLVGQEGDGFKIAMWQLSQTRLSAAGGALGVARAARDAAVTYANQREQFGQKIGQFQMVQDQIAQMVVHEEAARLLVYQAAWLADQGRPNNLEVSIAKYSAAEAAAYAGDAALRILGAYGYSKEFPVERYFRDSKSYQIVEGSSNIQKWIIAQDALGYRKANRAG